MVTPNPVHLFILIILIQTVASSVGVMPACPYKSEGGGLPWQHPLTESFRIMVYAYEWDDAKRRETLETRGIDFAEIIRFRLEHLG